MADICCWKGDGCWEKTPVGKLNIKERTFVNPSCYLSCMSNCTEKISREHFISRNILEKITKDTLKCINANLDVAEYTALQVKQGVVGHGKAKKEQVQEMVQRLLKLSSKPGTDAADALGVAICHAHSGDALTTLGNLAPGLAKRGFRVRGGRLI